MHAVFKISEFIEVVQVTVVTSAKDVKDCNSQWAQGRSCLLHCLRTIYLESKLNDLLMFFDTIGAHRRIVGHPVSYFLSSFFFVASGSAFQFCLARSVGRRLENS